VISVSEALSILRNHPPIPTLRTLPLEESVGLSLAEDTFSPISLPSFDNSAMDGYAVGGPVGPWEIVDTIPAGDLRGLALGPCHAARIFTGSRIPARTYAVIAQESVAVSESILSGEASQGQHLRRAGEELAQGDLVLRANAVINPPRMAALAALGISEVKVKEISCGVITTGNEVVEPGSRLHDGQIFNSNRFAVQSILKHWGVRQEHLHVQDDPQLLRDQIQEMASRHALVVTTGGVSVGDHDHVVSAAQDCGFEVKFHKVAVKPGKPIAFGVRHDGATWIGLPGNPLSTWVGMLVFFSAHIGRDLERRYFRLETSYESKGDRDQFIPGQITSDGAIQIEQSVGSHANTALINASALVHLHVGKTKYESSERVEGLVLPWSLSS
jgi:molybdopterin molybdotransferase